MTDKMKQIEFTKAAENALTSLDLREQKKAIRLLHTISENITDPVLTGKINRLTGSEINLFVIRLSLKLRIIIELFEDRVNVIDILNHDLFKRYFKKA
jgi:hypothetical protein